MDEFLKNEKLIHYDDFSQITGIINSNLRERFVLVRHNSTDKELFFKKAEYPSTLLE